MGYAKNMDISDDPCMYCEHFSCRSCSIVVDCHLCETNACEDCIDNDTGDTEICNCLKTKLELFKRTKV